MLGDLKGFLDALELDQVHYVGESIGGLLGVFFAKQWPERMKSLTLCATPLTIPPKVQKLFALDYEDMPAAIGALGSGGYVKELMARASNLNGADPAHIDCPPSTRGESPDPGTGAGSQPDRPSR